MKKVILTLCIALVSIAFVNAQSGKTTNVKVNTATLEKQKVQKAEADSVTGEKQEIQADGTVKPKADQAGVQSDGTVAPQPKTKTAKIKAAPSGQKLKAQPASKKAVKAQPKKAE